MIRTLTLLGVAAAFLLAACGTATPSRTPDATAAPTPTSVVTTEFGLLTGVDAATGRVAYRVSQFFEGNAAIAAAREDGRIGPNDDLPNPHYIRDLGREERRVLSPSVVVRVLRVDAGRDPVLSPIPSEEYLGRLAANLLPEEWYGSPYYSFEVGADGLITAVEHEYVP